MKLLSSLFLVCSLLVVGAASAQDTKVYAPSMCQPAHPDDAASVRYFSDGLRNMGTGLIRIQCPIVKDRLNTTGASIRVNVRGTGSGRIRCQSASKNSDGSTINPTTRSTRADTHLANSIESLNLDVSVSAREGFYNIFCTIPPGARILAYKVLENR